MGIPARGRPEFADAAVARVFETYAPAVKPKLLVLRRLILDTAAATPGAGELEETLKWGQPSYLTTQTKAGGTIRIDHVKSDPARYAMFFHCQTNLVETFRELYARELTCIGNRSIVFHVGDDIPERTLRHCVALALTYHLNKRKSARATWPAVAAREVKKPAASKTPLDTSRRRPRRPTQDAHSDYQGGVTSKGNYS